MARLYYGKPIQVREVDAETGRLKTTTRRAIFLKHIIGTGMIRVSFNDGGLNTVSRSRVA